MAHAFLNTDTKKRFYFENINLPL